MNDITGFDPDQQGSVESNGRLGRWAGHMVLLMSYYCAFVYNVYKTVARNQSSTVA